jgi:hypothetical protein
MVLYCISVLHSPVRTRKQWHDAKGMPMAVTGPIGTRDDADSGWPRLFARVRDQTERESVCGQDVARVAIDGSTTKYCDVCRHWIVLDCTVRRIRARY